MHECRLVFHVDAVKKLTVQLRVNQCSCDTLFGQFATRVHVIPKIPGFPCDFASGMNNAIKPPGFAVAQNVAK